MHSSCSLVGIDRGDEIRRRVEDEKIRERKPARESVAPLCPRRESLSVVTEQGATIESWTGARKWSELLERRHLKYKVIILGIKY